MVLLSIGHDIVHQLDSFFTVDKGYDATSQYDSYKNQPRRPVDPVALLFSLILAFFGFEDFAVRLSIVLGWLHF